MTATSPAPARSSLRAAFLTPRAIGLLALALLLAAVCGALAQWQISRAVQEGAVVQRPTERTVPLSSVAEPARQQTDASVGQLVEATGRLVPADTLIAGDRLNRGTRGWWVVGHAILDGAEPAQLAVALGWAPTRTAAESAAAELRSTSPQDLRLTGRYVDSDAAEPSTSGDPAALGSVSTARLVNLWTRGAGTPTYEGVLVLADPPAGLTRIDSPRPDEQVRLNLLNLVYAVEWVAFAVFAFFVWYRLVRDRWEQEQAIAEAEVDADATPSDARV